jgi:hypothetical protein
MILKQLCVVHLIRASLRYASKKYWVPLAKDLRQIYTAADEAAAAAALEAFAASWGRALPGDHQAVAGPQAGVRAVPGVPARGQAGDLYDG